MLIGIPNEARAGQPLVSASPDTAAKLIKLGYDVAVERGAGAMSSYTDAEYEAAGVTLVDAAQVWGADIVTCVNMPADEKVRQMKQDATLIARMNPAGDPHVIDILSECHVTGLAMDAIPRISRAQSMDVRSSMMNIAGYRAVIEAANNFGHLFTGQVTAAGKVPPAKVYVIGVGVAGLSAIGTASNMGAVVSATDVRPDVADQVQSLGATFVEIPVQQESKDGYARAMTDDEQAKVIEVYTREAANNDIVITTAQVPGRPAPLLLTAEAVAGMKAGSVIVDMGASEFGGNCELTRPGEIYTTENGVTIIGHTDLANEMPGQASQLYGQNIFNFIKLCTPEKNGTLVLDEDDDIVRGITVTLDGQIMWPPPPVNVSAAPAPSAKPEAQVAEAAGASAGDETSKGSGLWWKILLGIIGIALILFAPEEMQSHFIVFELAVVVGFYVITSVTHTLHTPLMSVTNAISGIIIVGALLQITSSDPVVVALSFIAIVIASINIFGGFLVTNRMLKMFQRSSDE